MRMHKLLEKRAKGSWLRKVYRQLKVILFALLATWLLIGLTLPLVDFLMEALDRNYGLPPENIDNTLRTFFLITVSFSLFVFFLFLGWVTRVSYKRRCLSGPLPFVSIVIPGYNEQETITRSIECALAQDYPRFEVIVVDDGSLDFTPLLIGHPGVVSVVQPRNTGKAEAVNEGVRRARGELILFSDSDSHLQADAISKLVPCFADEEVGLVAGQILVRQQHRLLMWWQAIEYIYAQALVKVAQMGSGSSITVAPGPICMYRRKLLLQLGGFKDRTLVEDFDMTLEVVHAGYKALYEPRAISWTSAPETFRALGRQRTRWDRGNLQVWKLFHRSVFSRRHGALTLFWLPYLFVFGFGGTLAQAGLIVLGLPYLVVMSSWPAFLEMLLLLLVFECITLFQILAILLVSGHTRAQFVIAALTIKPYVLYLMWIRLVAIYREVTHKEVTWAG